MKLDRIELSLVLRVETALTVGTGASTPKEGGEEGSVLAIHLAANGAPCIPAATLKGALRARCEDLALKAAAFGKVDHADTRGTEGCLRLFAAIPPADVKTKAETFDRPATAIDRQTGAAEAGKLFTQRAVKQGCTLVAEAIWHADYGCAAIGVAEDLATLARLLAPLRDGLALGRGGRLGYGRVTLVPASSTARLWHCHPETGYGAAPKDISTDFREILAGVASAKDADPPLRRQHLTLTATTPFLIVDPSGGKETAEEGETTVNVEALVEGETPVLWPSSLLGALRARAAWIAEIDRLRGGHGGFVPESRDVGHPADDRFLDKVPFPRRVVSKPEDLAKLSSVERLFGVPGWKGMLEIRALDCTEAGKVREITAVSIDRLTGGAKDGALFTFAARQGCVFTCELRLAPGARQAPEACDLTLFDRLFEDLREHGLMLGHAAARGFGWFDVKAEPRMEQNDG
jgi:CRISPR/Cas system CSM-associated protein Csm3 (group 7 of RAMP superfamily)